MVVIGALRVRKQKAIAKSNKRGGSSKQIGYKYQGGGWATTKGPGVLGGLTTPRPGPCGVAKHHGNGALTHEGGPFVTGGANTRRVEPHEWGDPPKEVRWAG